MENVTNLHTITTLAGKTLQLTQELDRSKNWKKRTYKAFGATCYLKEEYNNSGTPVVLIHSHNNNLAVCKEINKQWGIVAKPKGDIAIRINKVDYENLLAVEREFFQPIDDYESLKKDTIEQAETMLAYSYSEYWGDYSTDVTSQIVRLRRVTEYDLVENKEWIFKEVVTPNVIHPESIGMKLEPLFQPSSYFAISEEQIEQLREATNARNEKIRKEKEEKEAKEKEAKVQKELKAEAERKEAEENELSIFDAGVIYSSVGFKMLHSLSGIVKDGKFGIYTTFYQKDIPNSKSTFDLKEEFKANGFTYNPETKHWEIELAGNETKCVEFLKKHDVKEWPEKLGFQRCWECGTYSRKLDSDGYCGC